MEQHTERTEDIVRGQSRTGVFLVCPNRTRAVARPRDRPANFYEAEFWNRCAAFGAGHAAFFRTLPGNRSR
eukprot:10434009-Heterocapsa_arctica.AAC.1